MGKSLYIAEKPSVAQEFARALKKAREAGVEILAYDCRVTPDSHT